VTVVARSRRHSALAAGLIAYGLVGLVILVVVASGILRGLSRVEALSVSFEQQRRDLTQALTTASTTIRSTGTTVSGIDQSLSQAQLAVTNAATLSADVSLTMGQLAASLNVDIFGSQPFVGVAGGFTQASEELLTLSNQLSLTSNALATNAADARIIGRDLLLLESSVEAVRDGLKAAPDTAVTGTDIGSLRMVLGALLAWLAVQAIAAVFLGLWLLRRSRRRVVVAESS
jgi:hypothetical protein